MRTEGKKMFSPRKNDNTPDTPPPPRERSPGRPPLGPSLSSSPPRPRHRSIPSLGGESVVSGITNADEFSPNQRDRKQSSAEEDPLQVPVLDDRSETTRKLRLADIITTNPVEDEAETAIMQVIEEEGLVESSPEQILPLVPEELVGSIEREGGQEQTERLPRRRDLASMRDTMSKMRVMAKEMEEAHAKADDLVADGKVAAIVDENEEEEQQETKTLLPTAAAMFQDCETLFDRSLKKDTDLEAGESDGTRKAKSGKGDGMKKRVVKTTLAGKEEADRIALYLSAYKDQMRKYLLLKVVIISLCLGVAALLYYPGGNPMLGNTGGSISFLFLLIGRHLLLWSLAWVTEVMTIGYMSLQTGLTVRLLGPMGSLWLVQSRGLPFQLTAWSLYSFGMLSGDGKFAQHWLHYQDTIGLFNDKNPGGDIISGRLYLSILGCATALGVLISAKRLWWGLRVGRVMYTRFGKRYTKLLEQMILISEIGSLSVRNQHARRARGPSMREEDYLDDAASGGSSELHSARTFTGPGRSNYAAAKLDMSQKRILNELLGDWEEPDVVQGRNDGVSIQEILEFRQALDLLESGFPFSLAFGLCDSREHCVESAQRVYENLMLLTRDSERLEFEVVAALVMNDDGTFDYHKLKALIRLLRPDRGGEITLLDFVKSIDSVYKELRMFRASLKNAMQVETAVEHVMNFGFYGFLLLIGIAIVGYSPVSVILSISSVLVGFAFMIGSASADYFSGLMLILLRRPYDVGDRVAIAAVDDVAPAGGSSTWFVERVDLYATTVRYATTNEVATLSNGSLSNCRIINGKRSPKAVRYVNMKFATDVPYQKIQLFRLSVEKFVKVRPREWLAFSGFRASGVHPELGYIEYTIVLQHRESWQNILPILTSTADVTAFCFELAKKLGMEYTAPPMPVNLSMKANGGGVPRKSSVDDATTSVDVAGLPEDAPLPSNVEELAAMFDGADS